MQRLYLIFIKNYDYVLTIIIMMIIVVVGNFLRSDHQKNGVGVIKSQKSQLKHRELREKPNGRNLGERFQ